MDGTSSACAIVIQDEEVVVLSVHLFNLCIAVVKCGPCICNMSKAKVKLTVQLPAGQHY